MLHEVYPYNRFDIRKITKTLKNTYGLLPIEDRIIIRDGIKMGNWYHQKVIVKFKDINDILFLTEYCKRFKGRKVNFERPLAK
ncbi:hypothetical protein [Bacillus sp. S0628]|uniref:hypothetical protein n=1 Tax=Bacillus sp. S0628 TaxID=2957802 RepID=UPI00209F28FD|nr:hypothetical protein [Bacillus sp. S0628]